MISFGFLSVVSLLFCNGFILLFYIFSFSLVLSNLFIFCRILSWIFIAIYYKLIGANDGLASFRAFKLVNCYYKKVLENLTNWGRLCIIISVGGVEVLPLEVLPHKLPHTNYHTHSPADAFIYYILKRWQTYYRNYKKKLMLLWRQGEPSYRMPTATSF